MSGGGDKSNLAMIAGTIYGVALNDREQHRKNANRKDLGTIRLSHFGLRFG